MGACGSTGTKLYLHGGVVGEDDVYPTPIPSPKSSKSVKRVSDRSTRSMCADSLMDSTPENTSQRVVTPRLTSCKDSQQESSGEEQCTTTRTVPVPMTPLQMLSRGSSHSDDGAPESNVDIALDHGCDNKDSRSVSVAYSSIYNSDATVISREGGCQSVTSLSRVPINISPPRSRHNSISNLLPSHNTSPIISRVNSRTVPSMDSRDDDDTRGDYSSGSPNISNISSLTSCSTSPSPKLSFSLSVQNSRSGDSHDYLQVDRDFLRTISYHTMPNQRPLKVIPWNDGDSSLDTVHASVNWIDDNMTL
mmetsp:Transcript_12541/g.18941  ORF Transcript_12541/g.18941 Transcript_12541/m.18941 type:complete len:306 (-) Transcript_12541:213-1130(-)|eukprot:CAMPEP_0185029550 /NCGR_PEP_ID=MMETSP1103-20130426/15914_1 /TAXON_ID=36769 /ORGANISM="Paraphysomonas bandaiensis, Strain Caron Lab Isolate" /LENGTH=305 /DNA_ID=CAMNT_0027564343 /DNA_START=91 /DNA_END=1008 /DNA_ORIENTATION=-